MAVGRDLLDIRFLGSSISPKWLRVHFLALKPRARRFGLPQSRKRVFILLIRYTILLDDPGMTNLEHIITEILPNQLAPRQATIQQLKAYHSELLDAPTMPKASKDGCWVWSGRGHRQGGAGGFVAVCAGITLGGIVSRFCHFKLHIIYSSWIFLAWFQAVYI